MQYQFAIIGLGLIAASVGCASPDNHAALESGVGSGATEELVHRTTHVNGIQLHYVSAGAGKPVVLIPGWPQSWYAWRDVIPRLVRANRLVVAIDPRGFGDSTMARTGYLPLDYASDLRELLKALQLDHPDGVDIIAHDVGVWIAFAHAWRFPEQVSRLVLIDAAIPGVSVLPSGIPADDVNVHTWHFDFNRLLGLPELLVVGRERQFLEWLFRAKSAPGWQMPVEALHEYTRTNTRSKALSAGLAHYRTAFSTTGLEQFADLATRKTEFPVLAIGGEHSTGDSLYRTLRPLSNNVSSVVISGGGHYLPEEKPSEVADAVLSFWARQPTDWKSP